jgi:integrase
MPVRLTDSAIQAAIRKVATSGRMDLADAGLPGLRLRLTASGGRSWVLACRDTLGRMRRFPLGDYPGMGIADAREAARTMRVEVRKGADPVAERRRQRRIGLQARDGIGTLTALLDLYAKQHGARLKSWPECRRRIDSVFAPLLGQPMPSLKMGDLQMQADGWGSPQSAAAAVRYLRPVLKWAAQRSYAPLDLSQIKPPVTVGRRRRILSRQELRALLPTLKASQRPYADAMRFLLLTLSRRDEAARARWRDVDLDGKLWTIPETKNGEPHQVPLSRQAVDLLRSRLPTQPSDSTPLPHPDAFIFATSGGSALANWDRETKRIIVAAHLRVIDDEAGALTMKDGSEPWTRHDLRRTGATMLGNMGVLPDIIEAALNHTSIRSALAATYNRSRYRPQVADALQRLADTLDAIEAEARTSSQASIEQTG